jgi:hypothetical protein
MDAAFRAGDPAALRPAVAAMLLSYGADPRRGGSVTGLHCPA